MLTSRRLLGILAVTVCLLFAGSSAPRTTHGPLNFLPVAPQGFGDRQNSWAWSMAWWRGHVYVGTNRAFGCVKQWELNRGVSATLFPYPPNNPDLVCTPDPADLPLQAEIWRFDPITKRWERVYQSPADLVNPDKPTKSLARDIGYRAITVFTEQDGTEALYVGGVSSQPMWNGDVPPPRILRTTDGINFAPLPQDAGTFLGNLPYSNFRSFVSYDGRLYVVNGKAEGQGILIRSGSPKSGNDAWEQVSPSGLSVFETAVFNGWLYVGTLDARNGFSVLKTNAQGQPPNTFQTLIRNGAYAPGNPGAYAWSLHVFKDQLYVGAGMLMLPNPNNCDLLRINPDDTWDLIAGTPRDTPDGFKYPLSGLPNGFGNEFNDGLWRIGSSQGTLFLGSSDESNSWSFLPGITPSLNSIFGFDLFATQDGVHITQISHDGFHDGLNYGISRMTNTPFGMFIASANVQFGLGIWRNSILPSSFPAPQGLAIELSGNSPMLSWNAAAGAAKYRILRAPLVPYTLYPALFGNQTVTGEHEEIGTVTGTTFTDAPLGAGAQYLYMVQAEDASGKLSDPSNLAYAPPLQPPATFDGLRAQIERLRARKYFTQAASGDEARASLERARSVAAAGNFVDAALHLENVRRILSTEGLLKVPYGRSEALYAESLARRLTLVGQGKLSKNSRF